jgi:hypothetical protein
VQILVNFRTHKKIYECNLISWKSYKAHRGLSQWNKNAIMSLLDSDCSLPLTRRVYFMFFLSFINDLLHSKQVQMKTNYLYRTQYTLNCLSIIPVYGCYCLIYYHNLMGVAWQSEDEIINKNKFKVHSLKFHSCLK